MIRSTWISRITHINEPFSFLKIEWTGFFLPKYWCHLTGLFYLWGDCRNPHHFAKKIVEVEEVIVFTLYIIGVNSLEIEPTVFSSGLYLAKFRGGFFSSTTMVGFDCIGNWAENDYFPKRGILEFCNIYLICCHGEYNCHGFIAGVLTPLANNCLLWNSNSYGSNTKLIKSNL